MYPYQSQLGRRSSLWTLIVLAVTLGIATGFAIPLAASYQPKEFFHAKQVERPVTVLEIQPVSAPVNRDSEVERLSARNRRLEALLAALRSKKASADKGPVAELRSDAVFGQN